jgi:hypothetical protein
MKKWILTAIIAVPLCVNAQTKGYKNGMNGPYDQVPVVELVKQRDNKFKFVDGSHFYPTVKNSTYKLGDKITCNFGIGVEKPQDGDKRFYIQAMYRTVDYDGLRVDEDAPLLIKLEDDSVIKLHARKKYDTIGDVIRVMGRIMTRYDIFPEYPISREDVEKLKIGIKKIRYEANAEKFDIEFHRYKNDEIGEFLFNESKLVETTLDNTKDFDEDF